MQLSRSTITRGSGKAVTFKLHVFPDGRLGLHFNHACTFITDISGRHQEKSFRKRVGRWHVETPMLFNVLIDI